ncbi:PREDICTED: piggyBac transposable element-derived protein 4-like [Eufriesea mexicana]|uniref:piggyBac transposable element-derived protein 4-like n=1 Tax=Eufriesea mexicana TaxID=516756 RepID=UPI00083BC7EF|nr:PREDICTED: piggyBac transposable element-derived protein 4-like [Eufriesea mexicana]
MEIRDSPGESIIGIRRNVQRSQILSTSSEDASNDSEPLAIELDESTTEEEYFDSDIEEGDLDDGWQEIIEGGAATNVCWEEEELLIDDMNSDDPVFLYKLFVTGYILLVIVAETNKYATECMNHSAIRSRRQQQAWQPFTKEEMNTFIGTLLIMGVLRLPEIRLYLLQTDVYSNTRIKRAMEGDRFISILKYSYFFDNSTARTENRLYKLRNIVDAIVHTLQNSVKSVKNILIDETIFPWRGRHSSRQYIPGKLHLCGIKIYKLCLPEGHPQHQYVCRKE